MKQHFFTLLFTGLNIFNNQSAIIESYYDVSNKLSAIKSDAEDYIIPLFFYFVLMSIYFKVNFLFFFEKMTVAVSVILSAFGSSVFAYINKTKDET